MINRACEHTAFSYTGRVPETTGTEIGVSINVGGQAAVSAAIFSSVMPLHVHYGRALAGERLRSPVPTFRYANPVICPPTPIGVGKRVSNINVGDRIMRQAIARPEQTNQSDLQKFINAALRDATNASTIFHALDTLADALRMLADLSKGMRHA
ncbi:hypothetical protein [Caballeronia sp. INML2]|uniref:hypothetical protein n=1 Tax=Caballeronia sp. INML2 TaxID=2921748 RepID=UPI002028FF23|nr:hypothetical protein [Caballeronia sp. INML2]